MDIVSSKNNHFEDLSVKKQKRCNFSDKETNLLKWEINLNHENENRWKVIFKK